ncbi:MAG: NAD(P)/FAD-dependent oxidoreductase [Armatimonadetes bacterium]|nr:NAD(P)/FAD-dependent oxidoreductase [Armatimonadota bacterium]
MECDVLVVGAGPGGGMAALTAARLGLRTILLEEHAEVGCPAHCTGKLSDHAFREFTLPRALAINEVSAAVLHGPLGAEARIRRRTVDSYIVDRDAFDQWLAGEAQKAGAEVLLGARARRAARDGGWIQVTGGRGDRALSVRTRAIIDAEGARPVLPQTLGLHPSRVWVHGLQYQVTGAAVESEDAPELYFGHRVAPGFFAWIMPLGGSRARVGLCIDPRMTHEAPVAYLDRFMREHPAAAPKLRRAKVERRLAGRIPILGAKGPSYAPGLFLVGDAAGQVKATSGGGIYFAMIAGALAAQAAAAAVGGDAGAYARYEQRWRRRFGRELWFTAFARRALNRLADPEMDLLLRIIGHDAGVRRAIEEFGDTAYQSRLLTPLLRQITRAGATRPATYPILVKIFGSLALSWL